LESQFAAVLIKPDAVRDCLELMILEEIKAATGVEVAFRKFWRAEGWHAGVIYPEWLHRPEFPAMKRNLIMGPSMLVVVKAGHDIFARLKSVKAR
jgi:nucleoside diphosphate kinase